MKLSFLSRLRPHKRSAKQQQQQQQEEHQDQLGAPQATYEGVERRGRSPRKPTTSSKEGKQDKEQSLQAPTDSETQSSGKSRSKSLTRTRSKSRSKGSGSGRIKRRGDLGSSDHVSSSTRTRRRSKSKGRVRRNSNSNSNGNDNNAASNTGNGNTSKGSTRRKAKSKSADFDSIRTAPARMASEPVLNTIATPLLDNSRRSDGSYLDSQSNHTTSSAASDTGNNGNGGKPKNKKNKKRNSKRKQKRALERRAAAERNLQLQMLNRGNRSFVADDGDDMPTDPLQGAKIYVLPVYSEQDLAGSTHTNNLNSEIVEIDNAADHIEVSYIEKLSHDKVGHDVASFISSLGGSVANSLNDATHAVWPPPVTNDPTVRNTYSSLHLQTTWAQAESNQVPILDAGTWLEAVACLRVGQHWSEIDVSKHVPAVFRTFMPPPPTTTTTTHAASSLNMQRSSFAESAMSAAISPMPVSMPMEPTAVYEQGHKQARLPTSLFGIGLPSNNNNHTNNSNKRNASSRNNASNRNNAGGDQQPRRWFQGWQKPRMKHRRDNNEAEQMQMNHSINQTFSYLAQSHPEQCEEEALKRAMELSLLDCALVVRRPGSTQAPWMSGSASRQSATHNASTGSRYPAASAPGKSNTGANGRTGKSPQEILGLPTKSHTFPTLEECKAAYRKLARVHHPDKGGSADTFFNIAKAYRTLLAQIAEQAEAASATSKSNGNSNWNDPATMPDKLALKSTSHWDSELQDHRRLVEELFTSHGTNLNDTLDTQGDILHNVLYLMAYDAGSTNHNEEEELIHNSCFYLSLAASYLHGIGALLADGSASAKDSPDELRTAYTADTHDGSLSDASGAPPKFDDEDLYLIRATALQLKRVIEAAVVRAHPEWAAAGKVGEEVQAFSDFLVYLLDSPDTLLSDWAVVVFDTVSGICDVYQGKFFKEQSPEWQSTNTITIQYLPGHYQPLVPMSRSIDGRPGSAEQQSRPMLSEVLKALDEKGAYYVVTDGAG